jgi:hypothetical protein
MSEERSLEVLKPQGGAMDKARDIPTVAEMFSSVMQLIQSGKLNSEGVQAAGDALKLCERMADRDAKQKFIQARIAMQPAMKKIVATHAVPAKDGTIKYKTAYFEEIDDQARPVLGQYGFSVAFKEGPRVEGLVTKILVLQHEAGHSEEYPYTVRIGAGPYGASETQADNAAHTSAKRRAFCDALNIVIGREDSDETNLGSFITPADAKKLKERVIATGTVEKSFLEFAKAPDYEHIYTARFEELHQFLSKRERFQARQRAAAPQVLDPAQAAVWKGRVLATGVDLADFLRGFGVATFEELPKAREAEIAKKILSLEGAA